jgi:hypothetical protein
MNTATNGYYARVALSFARKIDTDLIAFVRNVITQMTGNTQYPAPSPTLAEVTTSVNDFETAVHDALDGGKIAIATRNAAREALLALMRQLAAYMCRGTEMPTCWRSSARALIPCARRRGRGRCPRRRTRA